MSKRLYKDLILVLIYTSNGKWTWYQLERALDLRGIGGKSNSVKMANALIQEGLVEEQNYPDKNLSMYIITDKGKEKVRQLIDEHGPEAFASIEQNPEDYE